MRPDAREPRPGALIALALAGGLLAGCAGVGDGSPLSARDRKLMEEATQSALERNKLGQSANWQNPESGNLGTVTPLRTFYALSGQPCREYQQTLTISGRTEFAYDAACRETDGAWASVSYPGRAGSRFYETSYGRPPYRHGYPYDYGYPHGGFGFSLGYGRSWHGR